MDGQNQGELFNLETKNQILAEKTKGKAWPRRKKQQRNIEKKKRKGEKKKKKEGKKKEEKEGDEGSMLGMMQVSVH